MSGDVAEPVEEPSWRPEHGPKPIVRTWPRRDPPALWVWSKGQWRWATVIARQDWPDGRFACQVSVDLDGSLRAGPDVLVAPPGPAGRAP